MIATKHEKDTSPQIYMERTDAVHVEGGFDRIPWGEDHWDEEAIGFARPTTCGDCGVGLGEIHWLTCDMEQCPICNGQLLSCDCHATAIADQGEAPQLPNLARAVASGVPHYEIHGPGLVHYAQTLEDLVAAFSLFDLFAPALEDRVDLKAMRVDPDGTVSELTMEEIERVMVSRDNR